MSDAHAKQYYAGQGTETSVNCGTIDTYLGEEVGPASLQPGVPVEPPTPQPGMSAPINSDKRRGSS